MATETGQIRIAVDAMGGDHAPSEIVKGAVEFAASGEGQVMLVGDPEAVQHELAAYDVSRLPIGVIPSEGVIEEGEPPALALRQKAEGLDSRRDWNGETGYGGRLRVDGFDGRDNGRRRGRPRTR